MSDKIKLTRGEDVKYIDAWALEDCKALGWEQEGEKPAKRPEPAGNFDREKAVAALTEKGVKVHPKLGIDKIAALLAEHEITL